jgi:hypothetical protein
MRIKALFFVFLTAIVASCSKDSASSGNRIYYVIKATYDNPTDHDGMINAEVTHVALTMPSDIQLLLEHYP